MNNSRVYNFGQGSFKLNIGTNLDLEGEICANHGKFAFSNSSLQQKKCTRYRYTSKYVLYISIITLPVPIPVSQTVC
jgi:hypothetical protein